MQKSLRFTMFILPLFLLTAVVTAEVSDFPGKTWMQYVAPEDAGYSSNKLHAAKAVFEASEGASVLVIHDGRVLASWGQTTRRFRCASIRKSYLSALYGIYVEKGKIDLNETLADLNIDDIQGLTEAEKQAKVVHLLSARSGVYHPSAYSTRSMETHLPERGSHAPGAFWYYNNWDFNALATIFEQETGKGVFDAFKEHIAEPLQMEDFSLWNTYYRREPDKSRHPAYLFRMTARDMARFGLLYLNNGRWKDKQIIPADWVEESTQPVAKDLGRFEDRDGYGYLWWISDGIKKQPMYYASGNGGQRICVLPESKLVFVHTVNTYDNNNVSQEQIENLIGLILEARVAEPQTEPRLVEYDPTESPRPATISVNEEDLSLYSGTYRHRFLGEFDITVGSKYLIMETGIGKFKLFSVDQNQFFPEDIRTPVFFEKAEGEEKKHRVVSVYNEQRKVDHVIFYY